jgi:hypothetical protein
MDEGYVGHASSGTRNFRACRARLFRDQVHCSLQNDVGSSVAARSGVGLRALLFATDYPHSEGAFPFTNKVIEKMREQNPDLIAEELVEALGGNAVKIFTRADLRPRFEARTREFLRELHGHRNYGDTRKNPNLLSAPHRSDSLLKRSASLDSTTSGLLEASP